MCGRFVLQESEPQLMEHFSIQAAETAVQHGFNRAPAQDVTVLLQRDGRRTLETREWGLVPAWAKPGFRPLINARAETLVEKPSFRVPLRRERCVVPASGFYEWKPTSFGKQPYYISLQSGKPMGFAGICDTWVDLASQTRKHTVAIVTTAANAFMTPLHNRMPALLEEVALWEWLDERRRPDADWLRWLQPCPDTWLQAWPVSREVNTVSVDAPFLIEPVPEPAAPAPSLPQQPDLFG